MQQQMAIEISMSDCQIAYASPTSLFSLDIAVVLTNCTTMQDDQKHPRTCDYKSSHAALGRK